jgi:hypothetical protein
MDKNGHNRAAGEGGGAAVDEPGWVQSVSILVAEPNESVQRMVHAWLAA